MLKKKFVKDKCVTCKQCMIECAVRHSVSRNLYEAFTETPKSRYPLQMSIKKNKIQIKGINTKRQTPHDGMPELCKTQVFGVL